MSETNNIVTYLADKETLDTVNESVSELKSNLSDVADKTTQDNIEEKVESLSTAIGSAENSSNSLYGKIDNILQKTSQQLSVLNGESTPFGTGYMGDITISDSNYVFPANDSYGRCVIQCGNFTLNEGVTLTVPKCTGFYIFATGDINIHGTIKSFENNLYGTEYNIDMVDHIEIDGNTYYFAKGGVTREYGGTIVKNTTSITNLRAPIMTKYESNVESLSDTLTAVSLTCNSSINKIPHVSGGSLIQFNNITCTMGYTGAVQYNGANHNLITKTDHSITYSNRIGSASVILICKNKINIQGIIDTSSTSFNNTLSVVAPNIYSSQQYSSRLYTYTHVYDSNIDGTIKIPSGSGGITIISKLSNITGTLNSNCGNAVIPECNIDSYNITKTKNDLTAQYSNNSYYGYAVVTTGAAHVNADTIIGIPGEIKIYELGGES